MHETRLVKRRSIPNVAIHRIGGAAQKMAWSNGLVGWTSDRGVFAVTQVSWPRPQNFPFYTPESFLQFPILNQ